MSTSQPPTNPHPHIFVREEHRNVRLNLHDILYIEARRNYSRLVTTERIIMTLATLLQWQKSLPPEMFCQTHRGFIVSIPHIHSFDKKYVYIRGAELPIGKKGLATLRGKVTILGTEMQKPQQKALIKAHKESPLSLHHDPATS